MKSITYWHPRIYSLLIKLSYRKGYKERYETIARLIEDNTTVTDVCCGDCKIYDFLDEKSVGYLGLDFNAYFVKKANDKGIMTKLFNLYTDELPQSDYILFMASLYQFYPNHKEILHKLFRSAKIYLILSESIVNYAHSKSKIVVYLANKLNNPGDGTKEFRFDIETLKHELRPYENKIIREFYTANNKEYVVVIKKE